MKSQLDLIISIVAIVFSLVAVGVFMGTAPEPKSPPAPPKVETALIELPNPDVTKSNGLPGGGATTGGGGGGGGGAAGGGGGGQRTGGPRRGATAN